VRGDTDVQSSGNGCILRFFRCDRMACESSADRRIEKVANGMVRRLLTSELAVILPQRVTSRSTWEVIKFSRIHRRSATMNRSETSNALKQFRKTRWRFQQTFKTPLKSLHPFVAAIISAASAETACVTIEQAVFEPKHWIDLLVRHSLTPGYAKGVSVNAVGQREVEELLQAAFTDWFDFIFVPTPKPFVIYADHDEYTTFYANTHSNLNRVVTPLSALGFEQIPEYTRQL
jgi:hypothetical protein